MRRRSVWVTTRSDGYLLLQSDAEFIRVAICTIGKPCSAVDSNRTGSYRCQVPAKGVRPLRVTSRRVWSGVVTGWGLEVQSVYFELRTRR